MLYSLYKIKKDFRFFSDLNRGHHFYPKFLRTRTISYYVKTNKTDFFPISYKRCKFIAKISPFELNSLKYQSQQIYNILPK